MFMPYENSNSSLRMLYTLIMEDGFTVEKILKH